MKITYTVYKIDANQNVLLKRVYGSWDTMSKMCRRMYDDLNKGQGIAVYDDAGTHLETVMKYG